MNFRLKFLKVKIKSLAEEARIIRKEELRARGYDELREQLYLHRIHDVRDESRATQLAYAYLRGREYGACEHAVGESFWESHDGQRIWKRVLVMVAKYRDPEDAKNPGPSEWRCGVALKQAPQFFTVRPLVVRLTGVNTSVIL